MRFVNLPIRTRQVCVVKKKNRRGRKRSKEEVKKEENPTHTPLEQDPLGRRRPAGSSILQAAQVLLLIIW